MAKWRIFFLLSGLFNIVGGISGLFLFERIFTEAGMSAPLYRHPFQLLFLFVIILGVGYLMVWRDPLAHRGIVWIGCLSKIAGFAISLYALEIGELPPANSLQPWIADFPFAVAFGLFLYQTRGTRPARKDAP